MEFWMRLSQIWSPGQYITDDIILMTSGNSILCGDSRFTHYLWEIHWSDWLPTRHDTSLPRVLCDMHGEWSSVGRFSRYSLLSTLEILWIYRRFYNKVNTATTLTNVCVLLTFHVADFTLTVRPLLVRVHFIRRKKLRSVFGSLAFLEPEMTAQHERKRL